MNFKKIALVTARTLFGALFVFSGASGLFHLMPAADVGMPAAAKALSSAMVQSGYLMSLVYATQLGAGLLLVSGFFVPLALVVIAPVVVNIVAFHLFLAPAGMGIAVVTVALELILAWNYRSAFAPLLRSK